MLASHSLSLSFSLGRKNARVNNSLQTAKGVGHQSLQVHKRQLQLANVFQSVESVGGDILYATRQHQMLDVCQSREGVAVYRFQGIVTEDDEGDLRATGERPTADVVDLVVRQDYSRDVLQCCERELADVGQRGVLDREDLELGEAAEGEGLYHGDVVAVEVELFERAETTEGLAADHREVVVGEGQLFEVGRESSGDVVQATCVAENLKADG